MDNHELMKMLRTVNPPTPDQRRKVALIVCGYYAHDPDAAAETLAMLGLLPVGEAVA